MGHPPTQRVVGTSTYTFLGFWFEVNVRASQPFGQNAKEWGTRS